MSNSPLVDVKIMSPNHSGKRTEKITKIAIHHMAGIMTARSCGHWFSRSSTRASSQYGVGSDAKIGQYVDEANRAWTTASSWCDNRAVTIEVSNSTWGPEWRVSDAVLAKTIDLVYDICKRNGIYPCTYTGDKNGTLQMHKWYTTTSCPGPYLGSKFPYIAAEVTRRLKADRDAASSAASKKVKKSNIEIAKEVWRGLWGNGQDRINRLTRAGYNAKAVQAEVDKLNPRNQAKAPARKSNATIAREVIDGKWGNGATRRQRLEKAGYSYNAVQNEVNKLLRGQSATPKKSINQIAREVINGKWGNGADRKRRLGRAGYNYNAVQKEVNRIL